MNDECSSFLHCIHCSFTQCGVGVMINSNMRVFYEFMKKLKISTALSSLGFSFSKF